jgi:uncharacterized membrane protein
MRIVGLGHGLFVLAGLILAALSIAYHDFAPIWHVVPASLPGREVWVYLVALFLLIASVGLCIPRMALTSALALGAYFAICTLTRVPAVIPEPLGIGTWYGICEPISGSIGAWILYAIWQHQPGVSKPRLAASDRSVRVAQVLFGLTCVFYGLSHFIYPDYTASMVPGWLPIPLGLAYFTGAGHMAGGIGIVFGILPRLAATLEAIMMSLFGLLVWLPTFFIEPTPKWATPPLNQWNEFVITVLLAAVAWIVAQSLRERAWGFAKR